MARAKTPPPPTAGYIKDRWEELKVIHREDDDRIRRIRQLREMTRPVALEKRFVDIEVRDPTIADETQRVVATLTTNRPHAVVTPTRPGVTKDQENSTQREHWSEEVLRVCGRYHPGEETLYAVADATIGDGGGWSKLIFVKDLWEERYSVKSGQYEDDEGYARGEGKSREQKYDEATEDIKKEAGPPFYWIPVDALAVYPAWSGMKLCEVIEARERPVYEVRQQYGMDYGEDAQFQKVLGPDRSSSETGLSNKVWFIEYWNETHYAYLIVGNNDEFLVSPQKHGYGQVPYFYSPGLMMNWWRGHKVGMSVGETKAWLVEYKNFLRTVHANLAARDAYPPLFRKRGLMSQPLLGDNGQPLATSDWDLGVIIEGGKDEDLQTIQFSAETGKILQSEIALVEQMIEKLTTPRVSNNIGGDLAGAGFAMNQVLAEAKIKDAPFARHIERHLEDVTRFIWKLVKNKVKETVWVQTENGKNGWLGLGPDDLKNPVGLTFLLDPERPSAKLIEERYWAERVKNGTASQKMAIEAMGDNYDEVLFQQAIEQMRLSPWFVWFRDKSVLEALGRGDILVLAKEAEMLAMTGGSGEQMTGAGPETPGATGNEIVHDPGRLATQAGGVQTDISGPPATNSVQTPSRSAAPLARL